MKSLNFEFLRADSPELASLAGFAEQYAFADPPSALVKLRTFLEQLVEGIYDRLGLQRPVQPNLLDLLNESAFTSAVPEVVRTSMHAIRMNGNRAAHGGDGSTQTVLWLLQEAHKLGRWYYLTSTGKQVQDVPEYKAPTAETVGGAPSKGQLQREKKAVLQKLAAQEAQMQKLLDDLAAARKEAHAAKVTAEELQARVQAAQRYASALDFTEAQTRRRLINSLLVAAGWDVGANGQGTQEVGQEVEVHHQPTQSGMGAADYVLWDDNDKPLAVVEAKKTAVDPEVGRTQAKCYADGLEQDHGQRPVIFYTNGFDIWMWDDAAGYTPRKLYGFYSKESLKTLMYQRGRQAQEPLTGILPDKTIAGRLYQTEAVRRILDRFQNRYRKGLLVQATGTGKTRVAISICEALIRAGWANRILFLCDRRELRKQAHNAFKRFLPNEPRVYVTSQTYRDREHRIYLATYPAMMKCFETFDVGFFDLIIADESHRSIYNRYRDLLRYFDALQVGLTATPRCDLISHNTYELFDCENGNPTAFYSYEEAVNDRWLSRFEVETFTTPFLREGIKYSQMTAAA
jgi:type I restriction enzyme R subunit